MAQECLYGRPERLLHENVKVKPESNPRSNALDTKPWDFCQGELYVGEKTAPERKQFCKQQRWKGLDISDLSHWIQICNSC